VVVGWEGDVSRAEDPTPQKNLRVNSPLLLVVTGSVASEFEDLGGEVFEDCSEVDGGARTDTLSVVATLEHTVDTTDGELETGFRGAGCALGGLACCACLAARGLSGFALARLWRRVRTGERGRSSQVRQVRPVACLLACSVTYHLDRFC
jgi:hypothetical protein